MNKVLLPIILLLAMASPAKAGGCGDFANVYLSYEKPDHGKNISEAYDTGYYIGVIAGYVTGAGHLFSIPPGVNNGQLASVVGKFLRDNPQLWHLTGEDCLYCDFVDAWGRKPK